MKKIFSENSRREAIPGFYAFFQNIFDHPVYKINQETFCIMDLKFLFDGICSGLLWHLRRLSESNLQATKEQYGYLLEKYFIFMVSKLFNNIQITSQAENKPDALVETNDSIIIFEFTTEYYRISSLYDIGAESFLEDLYRLLFNEGREDPLARGKKEKGKFYKLNTYFEELKSKGKRILPVLITENYLGDYDLLDRFGNFMLGNIENKGLDNLMGIKPLIINLDDLEFYWAFSDPNNVEGFINYLDMWRNTSRGEYHYNFSYFVSSQNNGMIKNDEYKKFFNFSQFLSNRKL